MDFVADYTDCTRLRSGTTTRFTRNDYGAGNISTNGHPNVSGALDQSVLCAFRKDGVCARPSGGAAATSSAERQRAVRNQMMQSQLNNTFRSVERATNMTTTREREKQQARCMRLLQVQ